MQISFRIIASVLIALILIAVLAILLVPQPLMEAEPAAVVETPRPLPTPKIVIVEAPQETEPPAITPPAESAASGSDIILQPVEPATDSDLVPIAAEGDVSSA